MRKQLKFQALQSYHSSVRHFYIMVVFTRTVTLHEGK